MRNTRGYCRRVALTSLCLFLLSSACASTLAQGDRAAAAQALGKARAAVEAQPSGLIVCEAEEFQVASPGWKARNFGENYYAATFANCFLSRKAFLGAPEQCEQSEASIRVKVPAAGKYLALVRYEAAYRFETQFRVVIEQGGRKVLDRLYGARDNLKIWAFREKLKKEVGWSWGAVENIVWEGHDAFAELQPGLATITLIAAKQPSPAARRNVDLVMLTTDVKQVQDRIDKENYLPLDGMLTQSGDVWLRVKNTGAKPLVFGGRDATGGGNWQEHSPYWVHIRNWPKVEIKVEPGKTSAWTEVGSTMDSLADGQWFWTGDGSYQAEFGVKDAAGQIAPLATFTGQGDLSLAADADTRYTRRLRTQDRVLYDLLDHLKKANPAPHGKTPSKTTIYAYTFSPLDKGKHASAVAEFKNMYGLSDATADAPGGRGMVDVRDMPTNKLEEYCRKLGAKAKDIAVVSLGDEIGLPTPVGDVNAAFRTWLQTRGVPPANVLEGAADRSKGVVYNPDPKLKDKQPGLYYWSQRYLYDYGIRAIKERTDILRRHLPNAQIGANYSPHYPQEHMFLGEVFKWVTVFREDGMTLPWSEDYIWQVPVGTAQMNHINLDLFRAGLRGKPDRKILYYVMPHAPNNTPRMWRRLFYGAIGHGMKIVNLFEFQPVHVAYTENHVDDPAMYVMVLRSFREMGLFEDIVQGGQVRAAEAALWFSETGDIWGDSQGSFAAAKRGLYTAIRHQQVPLDIVVEHDALDGTLSKYKVLYLTDAHVSQAASAKIAAWVNAGGRLFATAGAGMFDELNRPNKTLRELLGVEQTALDAPADAQITFIKQDLPFAKAIDTVRFTREIEVGDRTLREMPAYCVRSRIRVTGKSAIASFNDGSPAITTKSAGTGQASYCAFLPSLSYYKPAIPLRPVDRGATEDAMIHFLPTKFDLLAAVLIDMSAPSTVNRPVQCSEWLVESTVIESKHGTAIPLVNWTRDPIKGLRVTLSIPLPGKNITLASGGKVQVASENGKTVLTLDLDAADAVIVR
jgi:hypothetical protein